MKNHDNGSMDMIWIVVFILSAVLIPTGSYAADDIYRPEAAEERRELEDDLYNRTGRITDLYQTPAADERSDTGDNISQGVEGQTREEGLSQSAPATSARTRTEKVKSETEEPLEVSVEKIKEGEWKIINKYGDFVGVMKSDSLEVFRLYDPSGLSMGRITSGGIWFPRNSSNRYTKIVSREAFLYLDALDAIEKVRAAE